MRRGPGRPRIFSSQIRLSVDGGIIEAGLRLKRLRALRLGADVTAASLYREALAFGLAALERSEVSLMAEVPDGEGEARAAR